MFCETLLSEILNCVVVSVRHEILNANVLSVGLQSIHQPCSITFYLFRGADGQENDLCELLGMKWSKNTST